MRYFYKSISIFSLFYLSILYLFLSLLQFSQEGVGMELVRHHTLGIMWAVDPIYNSHKKKANIGHLVS